MKKQFLLLLMMLLPLVASAYDIAVQNDDGVTIYYDLTNDGKELAVVPGNKSGSYSGNIVIPDEVTYMNRTRKVTSIGFEAFSNCSSLTSVSIGNSVTSIGSWAFKDCSGLSKVVVRDIASWCGISFNDNPHGVNRHRFGRKAQASILQ